MNGVYLQLNLKLDQSVLSQMYGQIRHLPNREFDETLNGVFSEEVDRRSSLLFLLYVMIFGHTSFHQWSSYSAYRKWIRSIDEFGPELVWDHRATLMMELLRLGLLRSDEDCQGWCCELISDLRICDSSLIDLLVSVFSVRGRHQVVAGCTLRDLFLRLLPRVMTKLHSVEEKQANAGTKVSNHAISAMVIGVLSRAVIPLLTGNGACIDATARGWIAVAITSILEAAKASMPFAQQMTSDHGIGDSVRVELAHAVEKVSNPH